MYLSRQLVWGGGRPKDVGIPGTNTDSQNKCAYIIFYWFLMAVEPPSLKYSRQNEFFFPKKDWT